MNPGDLLHGDPRLAPFTIWARCSRCASARGSAFTTAREIEADPRRVRREFTCPACGSDLRCSGCGGLLAAHEQALPGQHSGFIHTKFPRG